MGRMIINQSNCSIIGGYFFQRIKKKKHFLHFYKHPYNPKHYLVSLAYNNGQ